MNNLEKSEWRNFYIDVLRKPIYWIFVLFTTSLSYLFDLLNRTVGPDDLARPFYIGEEKGAISDYRWGMVLLGNLLSSSEFTPFIDKFLSITSLIISAVLFSFILFNYIRNRNTKYTLPLCTIFSCSFISYPLINEIWIFSTSNLFVNLNFVIVAICILLLQRREKILSSLTFLCSLLLSIAVSSYESSAFLYVTVVFCILLMDCIIFNKKNWFTKGLRFAIPVVIAVILRFVISKFLIYIMDLPKVQLAASDITWRFDGNLTGQIQHIIFTTFIDYFIKGLIYLPIAVFVISLTSSFICVIILTIKRKKFIYLFLFILLFFSLFLQTIIQGQTMMYRTAQTLSFFCPFSLSLCIYAITFLNKKYIYSTSVIFVSFLIYRQSVFLNKTLALNNQRSDNEAAIAYNIGNRLKQIDISKPTYIVGEIELGDYINRQKRPNEATLGGYIYRKIAIHFGWNYDNTIIYGSSINSIINWNRGVFIIKDKMKEYFSYYGIDANIQDFTSWREHNTYVAEAADLGMRPMEIRDLGDHILVYLGP